MLLFAFPCSLSAQKPSAEEQFFFDSANRERVAQQLPPLKWNNALAEAARQHASLMAEQENLSHQLPGEPPLDQRAGQAGARFSRVGENIAIGPQAPAIHTGWMHSPGHRANILDVHFTALGVGVIEDNGELYAVEDFSVAVANLNIEGQEEKVTALLAARGLVVSTEREKARKLCSDELAAAGHRPTLILSYEAPDISELPEALVRKIRDGKYREAAVGACPPKESATGIARFRITVLLFGAPGKHEK
ncbi:MAG TPA: CAP domain-containing protein [Candidatus Acidoferrum sp.]|nr:CAP domain-containing protein [Candidatus Acidoferrum sp.]